MYENTGRHAKVVFSGAGVSTTLDGKTGVLSAKILLEPQGFSDDDATTESNDDDDVTKTAGFIAGITIACVVLAAVGGFLIW